MSTDRLEPGRRRHSSVGGRHGRRTQTTTTARRPGGASYGVPQVAPSRRSFDRLSVRRARSTHSPSVDRPRATVGTQVRRRLRGKQVCKHGAPPVHIAIFHAKFGGALLELYRRSWGFEVLIMGITFDVIQSRSTQPSIPPG